MMQEKRSPIGSFIAIVFKGGKLLKALQALKFLKFTKVLWLILSMIVSVFSYSFIWGWWFALGFVVMLFIHEMGHVIALKIKGLPTSAPIFIPFLGAAIFTPPFEHPEDEAFVGYGGPLLGSLAALGAYGIYLLNPTTNLFFLALSYVAAFLNLFNLIPLSPLDGGRITKVIGLWFKWIGVLTLLGITVLLKQPSMLLIWVLVLSDFNIHPRTKLILGIVCECIMIVLMSMGFGNQPTWLNNFDIGLVTLLNFLFYMIFKYTRHETLPKKEEKPIHIISGSTRIKWLVYYFSLTGGLIYFMYILVPKLPHH
ncbi:MAG: site-2 protease family protein [Parcubacteria group bacterium]|nr:site-2 protease family protein [Parcubacteria group bacterium]